MCLVFGTCFSLQSSCRLMADPHPTDRGVHAKQLLTCCATAEFAFEVVHNPNVSSLGPCCQYFPFPPSQKGSLARTHTEAMEQCLMRSGKLKSWHPRNIFGVQQSDRNKQIQPSGRVGPYSGLSYSPQHAQLTWLGQQQSNQCYSQRAGAVLRFFGRGVRSASAC